MNNRSYVEHVAIRVRDLDWYIDFFHNVFGMRPTRKHDTPGQVKQAWLLGGLQFIEEADFKHNPDGRLAHVAIQCEDLKQVLSAATDRGISGLEGKPDWLKLPDGLVLECFQAVPGSVESVLTFDPRREEGV